MTVAPEDLVKRNNRLIGKLGGYFLLLFSKSATVSIGQKRRTLIRRLRQPPTVRSTL